MTLSRGGLMLLAMALALITVPARADGTVGRSLALTRCAGCHLVAADQGFEPVEKPRGPDFAVIAANPKTTAKSLRRFLLTTHKNPGGPRPGMPNPLLTNSQIGDVVAFILVKPAAARLPR